MIDQSALQAKKTLNCLFKGTSKLTFINTNVFLICLIQKYLQLCYMVQMLEHDSNECYRKCRYPMYIYCISYASKRCLKYWLKILRLPDDRYVKLCYNMLQPRKLG